MSSRTIATAILFLLREKLLGLTPTYKLHWETQPLRAYSQKFAEAPKGWSVPKPSRLSAVLEEELALALDPQGSREQ